MAYKNVHGKNMMGEDTGSGEIRGRKPMPLGRASGSQRMEANPEEAHEAIEPYVGDSWDSNKADLAVSSSEVDKKSPMRASAEMLGYIDENGKDGEHSVPDGFNYDAEKGPTCDQCMMGYYKEGKMYCTNVKGKISPYGSCNFYVVGPPTSSKKSHPAKVEKNVAVYLELAPGMTCKRCEFFRDKDGSPLPGGLGSRIGKGKCLLVGKDGLNVHANGCCIALTNRNAKYYSPGSE